MTVDAELARCREQLRSLALELSRAQDAERQRIARGLHDDLGQTLAAAKLRLHELRLATTDAARMAAADEVEALVTQAIRSSRALTFELQAPVLPEAGIVAGLGELAERLTDGHGIPCGFAADDALPPLSADSATVLYRVVRELLYNVAKHSGADKASVLVRAVPEGVAVAVVDDGRGFDPAAQAGGFGLLIARSRLEEIGGSLTVAGGNGGGSRVTIVVPA